METLIAARCDALITQLTRKKQALLQQWTKWRQHDEQVLHAAQRQLNDQRNGSGCDSGSPSDQRLFTVRNGWHVQNDQAVMDAIDSLCLTINE